MKLPLRSPSSSRPAKASPGPFRGLPNEVRVIGGLWKRSRLPVAELAGLRPTPARVRETLFNWLGRSLEGWRCLDAFAGTGALGFEAASRGAESVVLLEREPTLVASLAATKLRLDADNVRVERSDAVQWMARAAPASFDLILLDPPFDSGLLEPALAAACRIVAAGGFVYVESPAVTHPESAAAAGLEAWRQGRAGAVHFHLFRYPEKG